MNHLNRAILCLPTDELSGQVKPQRVLAIHRQHEAVGFRLALVAQTACEAQYNRLIRVGR